MTNRSPMEEIYRRYAKPVNAYIRSMCKNRDLADDITAETFLKAIKNIDRLDGGNVLTWLCAIAKNTFLDYVGKKERQNVALTDELAQTTPDPADPPEKILLQKDDKNALYAKLQLLDPLSREVVYLRMLAELSFREIGEILNKNESWARVVFYRSKNKLKGWMNDEIPSSL